MSLYVGYYYGVFLDSSRILSAEEIDCFYNGEDIDILEDFEIKNIRLVSSENEPIFILGKQVNSDSFYDVYYSGLIKPFDLDKFINFNKDDAIKFALDTLTDLNEILTKHNRPTITIDKEDFNFFTHTIS